MLFLCAAIAHSKELHYEKRKEDEEMKNFKKVIAFLMVGAMTLGMGLTAFAATDDAVEGPTGPAAEVGTDDVFAVQVDEGKAGDVVTINVKVTRDVKWGSGAVTLTLDENYVKATEDDLKAVNPKVGDCWAAKNGGSQAGKLKAGAPMFNGASTDPELWEAGTVIIALKVTLAKDAPVGTTIATISGTEITNVQDPDDPSKDQILAPKSVAAVTTEKVTEPNTPDDPNQGDNNQGDNNQGGDVNQGDNNQGNTANNGNQGNNNNAPVATPLPKAEDIKTVTAALEAIADLVENGKYNNALEIAKTLGADSFVSADAYKAFYEKMSAFEKVLADPNATEQDKIDAYNAMILTMQENLLSDKGKNTLMEAVKAKLNEVQGVTTTTAAPSSTKAKNSKTGDTAPVAALILVAIAAFGTAVVVYRKKVNA